MTGIALIPIGSIRTPFRTLEECPRRIDPDAEPCRIELQPKFAKAVAGIGAASHLWVFYWLDRADRSVLAITTPHDGVVRGVFANRSPARPNPIGLRAVRLLRVVDDAAPSLIIGGMDCLDGTPLLDIKPYVPSADSVAEATLGWMKN